MPEQGPEAELELEAANEEVRRLRALLIEKDAELGAAKGQLEEMAGHSARIMTLLHRVSLVKLPGLLARRVSQRLGGKG